MSELVLRYLAVFYTDRQDVEPAIVFGAPRFSVPTVRIAAVPIGLSPRLAPPAFMEDKA